MVVNYVATAALAVFIIIVYYVTIHDPSLDPFDATKERALSDPPNPLDDLLLRVLRSGPAYISKHVLGSRQLLSPRARFKLERVLIKVNYIRSRNTAHVVSPLYRKICIAWAPELILPRSLLSNLADAHTYNSAFCL